jgi:hypothetical protein
MASTIFDTQTAIIKLQNDILNSPGRKELLVRQGQLAEASKLMVAHPFWSKLLPALGQVTLKSARYLALTADNKGALHLSVTVSTYTDLDKFLQVFDRDEFNRHFGDVKVVSVSKYQVGETNGVKFNVDMKYDTSILRQE